MFSRTHLWFIGAVGLFTAVLWLTHLALIKSAINTTTASVTAKLSKQYQDNLDKAVLEATRKTKELQAAADKIKETKYETLQKLNSVLVADIVSLQQRAKRPGIPSNNPDSGSTCTAAQLYREDAEFLTGEAARAESVLIERDYYYDRYESIRNGGTPK
jgi:hypothetical protein